MLKKLIFKKIQIYGLIWILALTSPILTAQTQYTMESFSISFKIKNAGFNVDGTFKGLETNISFDAQTGEGAIEAAIEVSTIDTGINARDKHLRNEDYFEVSKYPKIKMKSTKIEKQKDGTFMGTFNLTIKNITKSIKMPFTFQNSTFLGKFTINRLEYGVGKSSWVLADNATISLSVKVK
jgi:polyisoprenoid-binding protein YceI